MSPRSHNQADPAVPQRLQVTIDTQTTSAPVSKYLYGQFIEHIGSTMYSSLWAEMLDDRKFYFPIKAKEPEAAPQPRGGDFGGRLRKWYPVGPEDVVSMDKSQPFVGDQSPRITLDAATPHGIPARGPRSAQRQEVHRKNLPAWNAGQQSQDLADLGRGRKRPADHYYSCTHQ